MAKYKIKWDEDFRRFYAYRESGCIVMTSNNGLVKGDTIEECEKMLRGSVPASNPTPIITEKEVEI